MPEFKTHNLWPIPVYESKMPVKEKWIKYLKNIDYARTHIGNSDISVDRYVLEKMPDLKQEVENHLENYIRRYLTISKNVSFPMLNSWVNIHLPNDEAQEHYHGNSLISGVYYLITPKDCGGIVFHKSSTNVNLFHTSIRMEYDETNNLQTERYVVPVSEGVIVFFPSHLSHSVQKNLSNEPRVSVAFNFWIKGSLGKEEYKLDFK
jgi:uncharacterized protein (TIGR02466 family)